MLSYYKKLIKVEIYRPIMNDKKKDSFIIPKKVMMGVAPAIAIIAILLSKNKAPQVLLFLIGIICGIIIGTNWEKAKNKSQ